MASLYRRLFTYRERESRRPLEDFLTEALADLLNRFPEHLSRSVVSLLLNYRVDAIASLEHNWPVGSKTRWVTQRLIIGGRLIDLVLEINGLPVLVVENKIAAGFQEHQVDPVADAGRLTQNQLATYGQWLAQATDPEWGGGLVLLTHWTPAPDDFAEAETYAVRYRSTLRWADLSRWLRASIRLTDAQSTDWVQLASELVEFLREERMDNELATGRDWAALQIYLGSSDRVANSVERLWESCKTIWRPFCQQANIPIEVSSEYGCIWKYRYLSRADLRSCYLAVGIRFPESTEYLSELVPEARPYLFLEIASDGASSLPERLTMPQGWLSKSDLRLARRPLCDFPPDADQFTDAAERWILERMSEAAAALESSGPSV